MPSSGTPESWEEIAILFLWVELSCLVIQVSCFIAADYQFCSCLKPNRKTWNQPLTILKFSWTPTYIYSGGWGMWGSEDSLSETVGFKNWTLIAKLVSKHPYPLNHLTGPQLTVCNLANLVSSYITQLQDKFITLKGDSIPLSHHSLSPWPPSLKISDLLLLAWLLIYMDSYALWLCVFGFSDPSYPPMS